jgi:hypothetical protein
MFDFAETPAWLGVRELLGFDPHFDWSPVQPLVDDKGAPILIMQTPGAVGRKVGAGDEFLLFFEEAMETGRLMQTKARRVLTQDKVNATGADQLASSEGIKAGIAHPPTAVGLPSPDDPDLLQTFIFHEGAGADGKIWLSILDDPKSWRTSLPDSPIIDSTGNALGNSWGTAATLAANAIHLVHQDAWANGDVKSMAFNPFGPQNNPDRVVSGLRASYRPASALYNGRLHVFHHGPADNGKVMHSIFDGVVWTTDAVVTPLGDQLTLMGSPSVVAVDDALLLFICDRNSQACIMCRYVEGEDPDKVGVWLFAETLKDGLNRILRCDHGPTPVLIDNRLYLFGSCWYKNWLPDYVDRQLYAIHTQVAIEP